MTIQQQIEDRIKQTMVGMSKKTRMRMLAWCRVWIDLITTDIRQMTAQIADLNKRVERLEGKHD